MTADTHAPDESPRTSAERPPRLALGPIAWLRANLFSSWLNTLITLGLIWLLSEVLPPLYRWMVTNSVLGPADPSTCRAADGACWAFIHEKFRFILFGTYPYEEQWRPLIVIFIIVFLLVASCDKRTWRFILPMWLGGFAAIGVLMWGGILGLPYVENTYWGGLPVTLLLAVVALACAFPLAILLALGRRSDLVVVRTLSTAYIEIIRGVPVISLLFMASVMLPLFLPTGVTIDKLLRACVALILFASAYLAEAIRGGLQAIPRGQYEAADSLGLGYWRKTRLIILPQALTIVIPPIVNNFILVFKDTSLVFIIGIYDLMTATKAALDDAPWRPYYMEGYLFIALIYFCFTFFMSQYSQWLEREFSRGHKT